MVAVESQMKVLTENHCDFSYQMTLHFLRVVKHFKMDVLKMKVPSSVIFSCIIFVTLLIGVNSEIDLTKEPGHGKAFGTGRPSHPVEEIVGFPDPETFFKNYYIPQKPVKFKTGAKMSPAFDLWTDEYFLKLDIPKDSKIHLETLKKENRDQDTIDMNFQRFVKIYANSTFYMVDAVPEYLSQDVILPCCLQCPDIMKDQLVENMMWFSSGGTNSVVHTDSVENINCVYRGTKDFVIVDPITYPGKVPIDNPNGAFSSIDSDSMDYVKYPGLAEVEYIHAHMEPGDCLYIPYKWIHQVRSYNSNLAVNIWWNHYDSLKTDLSKCNKECDKQLTLRQVKTTGFDALLETVENIKDHFVSAIEAAPGKTLTTGEFLNVLFPELAEDQGVDMIKEDIDQLAAKSQELAVHLDKSGDGKITMDEVLHLDSYRLAKVGQTLKEIVKIQKVIDEKFGDPEEDPVDLDLVDLDDEDSEDGDGDEFDEEDGHDIHDEL